MIARKAVPSANPTASTDTFGAKAARRPASPAPPRHLEEPRPSLQRAATQDAVAQENARFIFTTGAFADPPTTKTWKFGVPVLSDGHKRLLLLLREEAGRLYNNNNDLRARLSASQKDAQAAQGTIERLKHQLRVVQDIREQIADELAVAHESLADLDAMVDSARSKRLSRRLHLSEAQADELRHAN